ncbi:putative DNA-binding transcriptional regulator YafY [Stackebrandtia endophytica]|uniref:Putative DNA-binding transcriptional regulator YafY n=1 Tax=Stackebrandtia endophytica TaxID=1496996 RepID=A0A543AQ38_9ACTN|nr:YafY family protein [Stackebrandtia endophytica]TQL74700.1 putative DNA-binding transcriptional regulator YafY [Stackebrandtia endophytica]
MADVTRRMLALMATLQTGRRFSGEELADRLEVSTRTLRRDVERLRGYGYPVTTQPGPSGYYRLGAGTTLPPMVFDDEEAVATLIGLAMVTSGVDGAHPGRLDDAARRAFGRIDQLLPTSLRPKVRALRGSLETSLQPVPTTDPGTLVTIAQAAQRHQVVTFDYRSASGVGSVRRVEPYRHVLRFLRWYLLGWDLDRADWRVFRVDRIDAPRITGTPFPPRELPADSAEEYLRTAMRGDRREVVVTIDAAGETVADVFTWQDCTIESLAPDRTRLTVWIESPQWLILKLAQLDADFTVAAPEPFRDWCRTFAARLAASMEDH